MPVYCYQPITAITITITRNYCPRRSGAVSDGLEPWQTQPSEAQAERVAVFGVAKAA